MITTDDDRRANLPSRHQVVEGQASPVPFAVAEPADPRGQTLEGDLLPRAAQPFLQPIVVGKELHHRSVRRIDIGRITGKSHPAERALPLAEQGPDVSRHEARELKGALVAALPRLVPDRVAVV